MMKTQGNHDLKFNGTPNAGNYKDDPSFKKLSEMEQWRVMAEKGDVHGLLREESPLIGAKITMDIFCGYLHDAVAKLARDDPTAFVAFVQAEMLSGIGSMVIRARYLLDKELRKQNSEFAVWKDQPGFDELANAVVTLNTEAAKLLNINANTQLTLERVRKLRLANDKAEAKKKRPRQPRRQRMSPRPQPMTAKSRIGGDLP